MKYLICIRKYFKSIFKKAQGLCNPQVRNSQRLTSTQQVGEYMGCFIGMFVISSHPKLATHLSSKPVFLQNYLMKYIK